jgi:hypothetical protein
MENNFITSGDLAMWESARTSRAGGFCEPYYGGRRDSHGTAVTGVGLAAGLGGGALLLAAAGLWGLNQASKARARSAENQSEANSKTLSLLADIVSREANRRDSIDVDVQQTLRNNSSALGTGGTAAANALATAEALAYAMNGNGGVNSAIGGCNYLRVARVSGSRLCGCDSTCEG